MRENFIFNVASHSINTLTENIDNSRRKQHGKLDQSNVDLLTGNLRNQTRFQATDNASSTTTSGSVYVDTTNLDDYYYNYQDSINNLPLEELVPNALGYGVMLILGMIGNLLVITSVARYRRMHNVTNIFFLSLASADLLLITVCVPVKFARFFTFTWEYGEVMCKAVHYFQNLTIICSVLNLSGLSLERYYAILHPMRAKYMCTVTMARRSVILIWTMSVIMAIPILFGQRHRLVGEVRQGYWCVEDWDSPTTAKIYNIYMFIVAFALPLSLMAYAYTSICRRLWQVKYQLSTLKAALPHRASTYSQNSQGRSFLRSSIPIFIKSTCSVNEDCTRKQVVKMLVFVVALFAICWGPIMLNNVLVAFQVIHHLNHGYLKPMRQALWLMAYINSCLNPIVYGFMSKNFRESFRNTVRVCVWRNSPEISMDINHCGGVPFMHELDYRITKDRQKYMTHL